MLTPTNLGPLTNGKTTANVRSPTTPSALPNDPQSRIQNVVDTRAPVEASMDPLSQVRTCWDGIG